MGIIHTMLALARYWKPEQFSYQNKSKQNLPNSPVFQSWSARSHLPNIGYTDKTTDRGSSWLCNKKRELRDNKVVDSARTCGRWLRWKVFRPPWEGSYDKICEWTPFVTIVGPTTQPFEIVRSFTC